MCTCTELFLAIVWLTLLGGNFHTVPTYYRTYKIEKNVGKTVGMFKPGKFLNVGRIYIYLYI